MIARRPRRLGAYSRAVPNINSTMPSTDSVNATARATYSNRNGPPTQLTTYSRYVQTVEVLASTRSPALNPGPLPANRFRTVRSTIKPSSAIQRRCQAPQPNSTATTATLTHRLTRTVTSKGNTGHLTRRIPDRRGPASCRALTCRALNRSLAESNSGTNCCNPRQRQQLQYAVAQRNVLGLAGQPAVDIDGVAQDGDGERNHRDREPRPGVAVPLEGPQPIGHHHGRGRQRPHE